MCRVTLVTRRPDGVPSARSRFARPVRTPSRSDLGQQRIRDQDLSGLGRGGDSGSHVDVDAEVVAAELAGPAPVHPGAHPGLVPVDLDAADRVLGVEGGLDRCLGAQKGGHQAVAQALDDPALVLGDRRLHDGSHLAQQLEHGRIAGVQRPRREPDEVGEQQRQLAIAAATAGRLRDRLPHLKRRQAELLGDALAPGLKGSHAARDHLDRRSAGGRQRVAELLVAREPAPNTSRGGHQRGLPIDPRHGSAQPSKAVGGCLDYFRGSLDALAEPVLVRVHEPSG